MVEKRNKFSDKYLLLFCIKAPRAGWLPEEPYWMSSQHSAHTVYRPSFYLSSLDCSSSFHPQCKGMCYLKQARCNNIGENTWRVSGWTGAWWWWEWCTQGFSFKSCWEMNLLQSFSKQSFNVQATYRHRQLDKGYMTSSEGFFKLLRRIHMVVPVSAN